MHPHSELQGPARGVGDYIRYGIPNVDRDFIPWGSCEIASIIDFP
jgi:hypothetical protein